LNISLGIFISSNTEPWAAIHSRCLYFIQILNHQMSNASEIQIGEITQIKLKALINIGLSKIKLKCEINCSTMCIFYTMWYLLSLSFLKNLVFWRFTMIVFSFTYRSFRTFSIILSFERGPSFSNILRITSFTTPDI
jgi:hypothetical protein